MHRLAILFVLLGTLTSCTVLKPEGVLVNGSVWLVSQQDIRAAIAAARVGEKCPSEPVGAVIVHSRTEILVYLPTVPVILADSGTAYVVVRKENGQWRDRGYAE